VVLLTVGMAFFILPLDGARERGDGGLCGAASCSMLHWQTHTCVLLMAYGDCFTVCGSIPATLRTHAHRQLTRYVRLQHAAAAACALRGGGVLRIATAKSARCSYLNTRNVPLRNGDGLPFTVVTCYVPTFGGRAVPQARDRSTVPADRHWLVGG